MLHGNRPFRGSGSAPVNLYQAWVVSSWYLPFDRASIIWIDLSPFFASSVTCSNVRTNASSLEGSGYSVGVTFLGGVVSNSPPSFFQAGNPPSSTETLSWPKTLKVHHTLGAENIPCVS